MKKTAQAAIKEIINSTIKPILKENGYRKYGNTWNLRDGKLVKVVNIQSSMYNSSTEARFTINLGIYNSEFQKENIVAGKFKNENIKEYDCEIRQRLGTLSTGQDFWWTIFAEQDNEKVIEDLKSKLVDYGLKWLDSFHDLEDEFNHFVKTGNHGSTLVAAYLLNKDSLTEHFSNAVKNANPYYVKAIERWTKERKLEI